jgi:predicted O-methyltransferase YrrM
MLDFTRMLNFFRPNHARPWRERDANPGSYAHGLLGLEERKLLYHLARDCSGAGEIVDLGAFCGASALCLAAGLRDNENAGRRRVHSYDLFIADDGYMVDFIKSHFDAHIQLGQSFEHVFRRATAEMTDRIEVHAGDLFAQTWPAATPIELLFVDAAKTIALNAHILRTFFTRLIPGKSVVVQQDFYHPGTFYLVVVMDFLRDYFTMIEEQRDWSAAFLLHSEIPKEKLDAACRYEFTVSQQRAAIKRTMARVEQPARRYLALTDCVIIGTYLGEHAFWPAFDKAVRSAKSPEDPIWITSIAWGKQYGAHLSPPFSERIRELGHHRRPSRGNTFQRAWLGAAGLHPTKRQIIKSCLQRGSHPQKTIRFRPIPAGWAEAAEDRSGSITVRQI